TFIDRLTLAVVETLECARRADRRRDVLVHDLIEQGAGFGEPARNRGGRGRRIPASRGAALSTALDRLRERAGNGPSTRGVWLPGVRKVLGRHGRARARWRPTRSGT
ncbi:hypothetical protein, partial [Nonomuraea rubra]|uniref:hypothetical protein n=1 Tax=Nonomuraea rubra TaxID=46180 RepID=UPI0031F1303E